MNGYDSSALPSLAGVFEELYLRLSSNKTDRQYKHYENFILEQTVQNCFQSSKFPIHMEITNNIVTSLTTDGEEHEEEIDLILYVGH